MQSLARRTPPVIPTREFSISENVWPALIELWNVVDSLPLAFLLLAFVALFALQRWGTRSAALVILPSHHNTPIMVDKDRLSPSISTRLSYPYPHTPDEKDKADFEASLSAADFSATKLPNGTWVPRRGSKGKVYRASLGSVKEEEGSSCDEV